MTYIKNLSVLWLVVLFSFQFIAQIHGKEVISNPYKTFLPNKTVHDFGTILEKNGKVSYTFQFANIGKTPIVINDVISGCSCTTVNFTKNVIMPGKKGLLTVQYNPQNREGMFSKRIEVRINGGKDILYCRIKGSVISYVHPISEEYPYCYGHGLYMNLAVLQFPQMKIGEERFIFLRLANNTDRTIQITFKPTDKMKQFTMIDKLLLRPKEHKLIPVKYSKLRNVYNKHRMDILVFVDDKQVKPLIVKGIS